MFTLFSLLWAAAMRSMTALLPWVPDPAAGPYELVFALLVLFVALVPALHADYFSVGPLRFSEKAFTYVLAIQLACSDGWRSLAAAGTGALFGSAFLAVDSRGGCVRARFPQRLRTCCARAVLSWWESESPAAAAARTSAAARAAEDRAIAREQAELVAALRAMAAQGGPAAAGARAQLAQLQAAAQAANATQGVRAVAAAGGGGRARAASAAAYDDAQAQAPAPDPAAVDRLVALGFARADAERALRQTFGDENSAADMLLES